MAQNKSKTGHVRIIAGQWRSRKLPIHDLQGLRPTTDRVKETVFNWLAGSLTGSNVLDCFAGSGALAFEALSRYANSARLYELQTAAAIQLRQNLQTLKCDSAQVITGNTLAELDKPADRQFDLVFIDPPFRKGLAPLTINLLNKHNWLAAGALVYVEVEAELTQLNKPDNWQQIKHKNAGQVSYQLFEIK